MDVIFGNGTDRVVEACFMVEVVKADFVDIVGVTRSFINFSHKDDGGEFFFDFGYHPLEEGGRNEFHHVATETIYALLSPETYNFIHLVPGRGVERAVVQAYSLVPVVFTRRGCETIAAGFGRFFNIRRL